MKKFLIWLSMLLLLGCLTACAQTRSFTLAWDAYPDTSCTFNLYSGTNSATNFTAVVTNIPGSSVTYAYTAPDISRTNWLALTAVNRWGLESELSDVVATPTRPGKIINFRMK
jgi:hypothetical protein